MFFRFFSHNQPARPSITDNRYIGPYPMHDVVVIAVNAAVSAATITFASICQKFFVSITFI